MEVLINYLILLAVLAGGYLIGSINTSIIVSKLRGMDIREHGSGNAGATNALRTMGKMAGLFVLLGDALKAVIVMAAVKIIFPNNEVLLYTAGMGAVLGHNFPLYFEFKGGKGVLVSLTATFFADWRIGLISLVLGVLIIVITRYVSLGSVLGALSSVVAVFALYPDNEKLILFFITLAAMMIKMHMPNIVRLAYGKENKIGKRPGIRVG